MVVARTRVPATLEITMLRRRGQLRELRGQRRDLLEQRMAGLDAVLARACRRVRPEQSPLEERVADVDQQDEVALRGTGICAGRVGRSVAKLTSDPAERSAGSACGTDRPTGRRW